MQILLQPTRRSAQPSPHSAVSDIERGVGHLIYPMQRGNKRPKSVGEGAWPRDQGSELEYRQALGAVA